MSDFPFSEGEVLILSTTLPNKRLPYELDLWKRAFDFYNESLAEGQPHYHMGCRSCYYKVLSFLLEKERSIKKDQ